MGTITAHFSYSEFEKSATADRHSINNVITSVEVRDNVKELTMSILEPLRVAWGDAILITSGYRCTKLNALVGGVANSAHLIGAAADIYPQNGKFDNFCQFALNFIESHSIKFDEFLIEKNSAGDRWLHIAIRSIDGSQRNKVGTLKVS